MGALEILSAAEVAERLQPALSGEWETTPDGMETFTALNGWRWNGFNGEDGICWSVDRSDEQYVEAGGWSNVDVRLWGVGGNTWSMIRELAELVDYLRSIGGKR